MIRIISTTPVFSQGTTDTCRGIEAMNTESKKKKKLSLSARIMIGMGLGFIVGIFFGEYCAFLQIKPMDYAQTGRS
jgi:hypothetical protein